MSKLALLDGESVRKRPFAPWPQFKPSNLERLVQLVASRHWGGFPVPGRHAGTFASRFAGLKACSRALRAKMERLKNY